MSQASPLLEQRYRGAHPLTTLWQMLGDDRGRLILAALFQVIKHSPVWVMPLVIAHVIDLLARGGPELRTALLRTFALLALVIVQNVPMQMLYMRLLSRTARNLELRLRAAICRRLQHLSISYYTRQSSGALQSKLLRDVEAVQQLLMGVFEPMLIAVATIVVALVTTAVRAPWFLPIYALLVPAAVTIVRRLRRRIQDRNAELRQAVEGMAARLNEMTQLLPITRAHGEEDRELHHVEQRLEQVRAAGLRLDATNALFGSSAFVTLQLLGAGVLALATWLYLTQRVALTLGDIVLLTGYFNALVGGVLGLLNLAPQVTRGYEALRSIGEVLECPDLEHNEGKMPVAAVRGRITFERVSYVYPDGQGAGVFEIDLDVQPGETVAIVGPSGAGKTTLLNLVIGFLRPTAGRLLLDGQDMAALDLRTYRRFLSVVPQETILFHGTIRDNVTYGRAVDEARLRQALRDANALEFVERLPQGLDTLVGERGARLSGGQRQRLAIARALIRDPRVLILDEATSALDAASEALIQEALARLMRGRTTFVVAHRLSTIRHADRIIVMEHGRVVEQGTHAQLLARDGLYRRLQAQQHVAFQTP
ncbi:ABC transporter ATP-binding protein [Kallotenue papyrolyticum]|uniref:ABC transporter ATP-binding protein n=1 Tax=Kallotenue papyrolyticum TaxID=1325125 RepID=UPI0004785782|nr:ABC transporter ATP-binding protein [Kallotenue papyrolyticum]